MKARYEFSSDEQYNSYLRIYFSGQILASFFSQPNKSDNDVKNTLLIPNIIMVAETLIEKLEIRKTAHINCQ